VFKLLIHLEKLKFVRRDETHFLIPEFLKEVLNFVEKEAIAKHFNSTF